jgi:hypothetical protein
LTVQTWWGWVGRRPRECSRIVNKEGLSGHVLPTKGMEGSPVSRWVELTGVLSPATWKHVSVLDTERRFRVKSVGGDTSEAGSREVEGSRVWVLGVAEPSI